MTDIAQQLLARIEAIDTAAADNRFRSEAYERMADELKDAVGRATSPDGVVTVATGPGGSVTSVTFTEQFRTVSAEALSADVLHAIAEAKVAAARMQAEAVRHGLGDTELLDRVLDNDEQLFGDPRPSATAPLPPAPARQPQFEQPTEDGEDFDIYRSRQNPVTPPAPPVTPPAPPATPSRRPGAERSDDDFENFDIFGGQK